MCKATVAWQVGNLEQLKMRLDLGHLAHLGMPNVESKTGLSDNDFSTVVGMAPTAGCMREDLHWCHRLGSSCHIPMHSLVPMTGCMWEGSRCIYASWALQTHGLVMVASTRPRDHCKRASPYLWQIHGGCPESQCELWPAAGEDDLSFLSWSIPHPGMASVLF